MKLYQTVWKEGGPFRILIEMERGFGKVYMPNMIDYYGVIPGQSLEIEIRNIDMRPAKVEMARVYEGL